MEINATKDKAKKTFKYPNEDISYNYYKDNESDRYIYFKGGDGSFPTWDKSKNEFYDCE